MEARQFLNRIMNSMKMPKKYANSRINLYTKLMEDANRYPALKLVCQQFNTGHFYKIYEQNPVQAAQAAKEVLNQFSSFKKEAELEHQYELMQ